MVQHSSRRLATLAVGVAVASVASHLRALAFIESPRLEIHRHGRVSPALNDLARRAVVDEEFEIAPRERAVVDEEVEIAPRERAVVDEEVERKPRRQKRPKKKRPKTTERFKDPSRPSVDELVEGLVLDGIVGKWWKEWAVEVDVGANEALVLTMEESTDGFPMTGWPPQTGSKLTGLRVMGVDEDGNVKLTGRSGSFERPPALVKGSKNVVAFKDVPPEMEFDGMVQGFIVYGVFVLVRTPEGGEPIVGLLRKENFSPGFAEIARVGMKISVRVVDIDTDRGRLGLSIKDIDETEQRLMDQQFERRLRSD